LITFTQRVGSLQIERAAIQVATEGDSVGMHVDQPARVGDVVYRVTDD